MGAYSTKTEKGGIHFFPHLIEVIEIKVSNIYLKI
jgi:hypothetical protein